MANRMFTQTAYQDLPDFVFGKALHPVTLKNLNDRELEWLDTLGEAVVAMPVDQDTLMQSMAEDCPEWDPKKYDMD